MSGQRDLLVDAVADFAFVLAVILESDVLDLQVRADYLVVLPANKNMRVEIIRIILQKKGEKLKLSSEEKA